ncbi:MAG: presenilin family intramembrane aspartyl protease [Candidatus Bathyarchaeota archaeon]|jgi:presenilin-like A22 family membrane protease|nr:presenilin family intramembrane aspartyl protease [Candidatus Bathyarchaeota archaeon]
MNKKTKTYKYLPIILMGSLFVLVDLLAFLVVGPFEAAGVVAFENPSDPFNVVYFFLMFLVFTGVILLIIKFWKKQVLKIIYLGAVTILSVTVFYPLLLFVLPNSFLSLALSIIGAIVLLIALIKKPEWYVINTIAIFIGVGTIAIMGISLSVSIIILLLVAMAIYDAIAVYKTKHMIDLADSFIDLKLPVMFVVPKKRNYSLLKETKTLKEKLKEKGEREAYLLGVGDVVFPGLLAVSAFHTLASNGLLMGISVLIGTLIGYIALMTLVIKGKPQPGLPLLNTGAILAYIIAEFLIFGTLLI